MPKKIEATRLMTVDEYAYHIPSNKYIFLPTGEACQVTGVNAQLGKIQKMMASKWLRLNRSVHQITWAPGFPEIIKDQVITQGAWIEKRGALVLNTYHPPVIDQRGDAREARRWIDLAGDLFGTDSKHLLDYFAFKVQNPGSKINHALTLGSRAQGIGKDALLEGFRRAVGTHNWQDTRPSKMVKSNFNGYMESVVFRINEIHDLGDMTREQFYDRMKDVVSAPPMTVAIDRKYAVEYVIPNICGVVMTTNHKSDGLYLPIEDRRNFIAWSNLERSDFPDDYWPAFWDWYKDQHGYAHVAAFLRERDLSNFDADAPPRKTEAFYEIVNASGMADDSELADVLDELGNPDVISGEQLRETEAAKGTFLRQRKARRKIPHHMERAGYMPVDNPDADDRLWKVKGKRQRVYAKLSLSRGAQLRGTKALIDDLANNPNAKTQSKQQHTKSHFSQKTPPKGSNGKSRSNYQT
jgi:Family of unknown function (DUF5906)